MAVAVVGEAKFAVLLGDLVNVEKEKQRIAAQIEEQKKGAQSIAGRLKNKNFLSKAPDNVVAEDKERLKNLIKKITELEQVIASLQ